MLPQRNDGVNTFVAFGSGLVAAERRLEVHAPIWYTTHGYPLEEERTMEFLDKARVRLEHWIHHSEDHAQEYTSFAKELEDAGKIESARHLKDMIALSARSTECLKKAMKALG